MACYLVGLSTRADAREDQTLRNAMRVIDARELAMGTWMVEIGQTREALLDGLRDCFELDRDVQVTELPDGSWWSDMARRAVRRVERRSWSVFGNLETASLAIG